MKDHDAIEQAYKNGFEDGKANAIRYGVWEVIRDPVGMPLRWMHRECGRITIEASKYCPDCGAQMQWEG